MNTFSEAVCARHTGWGGMARITVFAAFVAIGVAACGGGDGGDTDSVQASGDAGSAQSSSSSGGAGSSSSSGGAGSSSSSGGSPVSGPAVSWNVYNGDLHPLTNGSLLLADGSLGQFSRNGTATVQYANTASGWLNFDSTAVPTESHSFRFNNVVSSNGSYPKTLTILARVSGNATTTTRVLGIQAALGDAGISGTLIDFAVRQNNGAGVSFFNWENAGLEAASTGAAINTMQTHIYHITITLNSVSSGTLRVYLDGNATPVIDKTSGTLRPTDNLGDNFIKFGDISSTVAYQSATDWLIWTNTGAYTPAQLVGKLPAGLGVTTGY